jgi:hypothetical protein
MRPAALASAPRLDTVTIDLRSTSCRRDVVLEDFRLSFLTVSNDAPLDTVYVDRVHVEGVRNVYSGFGGSPLSLRGFNISVTRSLFVDNEVVECMNCGGAIVVDGATNFLIANNVFRGNRTLEGSFDQGGAIHLQVNAVAGVVTNNLFEGNWTNCGLGAGAIMLDDGRVSPQVTVVNNTFVANHNDATRAAASAHCDYDANTGTVFANNVMATQPDGHLYACAGSVVRYSTHEGFLPPGVGNLSVAPGFEDLFAYVLAPTSPCRDAGDPDPAFNDRDGTRNDMGYTGGPFGLP